MYTLQCRCERPGCLMPAYRRRQDTAYADEELNYVTLCAEHHAENDEYWAERWDEYWSEVRGGLYGV